MIEIEGDVSLSMEHKVEKHIYHKSMNLLISSIVFSICFDGVVIAAQCTATFLRYTVLPRI